jgi:hypothetical protein
MNTIIAILVLLTMFAFGFMASMIGCLGKINQLTCEKETLEEWLEATRTCNRELIKENTRLSTDIELISNGKSIIRDED